MSLFSLNDLYRDLRTDCWNPSDPESFESPYEFRFLPVKVTKVVSPFFVTEISYRQESFVTPSGGIGSTSLKNWEISETDMFESSEESKSSEESTTT